MLKSGNGQNFFITANSLERQRYLGTNSIVIKRVDCTIFVKNHNLLLLDIYNGPSLGTSKFIVSNQREESICPKGSITLQYSTTTKIYCDIFLNFLGK